MAKNAIAKDLRSLSNLLDTHWSKNIRNSDVLQRIISSDNIHDWMYSLNKKTPLTFSNVNVGRNVLPKGLNNDNCHIEVEIEINICGNSIKDSSIIDPINKLGVLIVVKGYYYPTGKNDSIEVIQSWHLDKGESVSGEEEFSHPLYHLNFGGNAMRKSENDFGALLLLGTPRISHPPLDIVLTVDFVLRNFYIKQKHEIITKQKTYKSLLRRAVNRFWKPYAFSFASFWAEEFSDVSQDIPSNYIFPSLGC